MMTEICPTKVPRREANIKLLIAPLEISYFPNSVMLKSFNSTAWHEDLLLEGPKNELH